MRIIDILQRGKPVFSFEFFPPKSDTDVETLFDTIRSLKSHSPDYVSVTYGAGGTTRSRTVELTARIIRELHLDAMAHLTCVGSTPDEVTQVLDTHAGNGIENILALRGDPPDGKRLFPGSGAAFTYANELVAHVATHPHRFCIGVAGYPEGHPECLNLTRDIEMLRRKLDAGASFVISQLFFNNDDFLRFRDRATALGITAPIIAGIMPIGSVKQIKKFISMCGSRIPHPLLVKIEEFEHDPAAVHAIGVDHAAEQCARLLNEGVAGIHFYTLNKSRATTEILEMLRGNELGPQSGR